MNRFSLKDRSHSEYPDGACGTGELPHMSSSLAMSMMTAAEFLFSAALAWIFWKKQQYRRFPAMGIYLGLRVATTPIEVVLLSGNIDARWRYLLIVYSYFYWLVYIASAVLIFFICLQVFRSVLRPFPGLQKFGTVIFLWVSLASVIVCYSSVHWHSVTFWLMDIAYRLMRSVSILELCLLAFLCLCMNALQLSSRDLAFGLSLGFGLMATSDFMLASLMTNSTSMTSPVEFVYMTLILLGLGIWIAYAALPEPARRPVIVSPNSTIYRWNEIASALGYMGTRIAVRQPANSVFLSDIDRIAEKTLTRKLKEQESDS